MAELSLRGGHVALLDDDDLPRVLTGRSWYAYQDCFTWYVARRGKTEFQLMHKFLTGYSMTDHINGNGLDNRRANLRPATASQNQANRIRLAYRYGYRGVTWHKKCQRFQAAIRINNKGHYLGLFSTAEEAARAYDVAAVAAWGEYARPNFPLAATS